MVRLVKLLSRSAAETGRIGEQLGGLLKAGDTVALTGALGSGKSVLARGMMAGLGVTARMPSPSFVIVASYEGRHPVNHIDLYRLDRPEDAIAVGIEDMLYSDAVNIIEWAERLGAELPPSRIDVLMELREDPGERLVTIVPSDDRVGQRLLPLVRRSSWIEPGGRLSASPGPEGRQGA